MLKLSIITINRNNAAGLLKTIESVVSQTYKNFEYIVIDGGSADESVNIIKSHADKINFWVSEPDKGIYNAMNKGILKSSGEYCLFLNSGDFINGSTVLERIFKGDPKEEIIFGNIIYEGDKDPIVFSDTITLNTFLGTSIGHAASFIKRNLFDKHGLYNEQNKIVSDWEFFLKVFLIHKCSYRHINEVITVYQKGGISTTASQNVTLIHERNVVLKREFPELYDTIQENYELKQQLNYYTHSRLVQFVKKLQHSRLNKLKNKLR
jgi:glycosyltransferase involved in cell wall biosynthesis